MSCQPRKLEALRLQPVAQPSRADHVVPVVGLDVLQDGRRGSIAGRQLEPRLELDDAGGRVAQLDVPREAIDGLELLDRVALDAGANALSHRSEQVDQHATAQQAVDLRLARAVSAHQALQGGRLVGCVVVDVQIRVALEPFGEEVHERLEGGPLAGRCHVARAVPVARPEGGERAVHVEDAEEVVEAVVVGVRVALDIEEEVARARQRQPGQATFGFDRLAGCGQDELVRRRPHAASLHLEAGLGVNALERRRADAGDLQRQGSVCQPGHRLNAGVHQSAALVGGDARHQRQVVVLPASLLAQLGPAADAAVRDRLGGRGHGVDRGDGRRLRGAEHDRLEALLGHAVVGEIVVDPQAGRLARAAAEHDPHLARPHALDSLQLLDVGADLQDGAGLDVARQLRVRDLVVVRPPDR